MNKKILNKIKMLSDSESFVELDAALSQLLSGLDCDLFSYNFYPADFAARRQTAHTFCTHQVQGWQAHYSAQNYECIDPILHKMRNSFLPISWVVEDELTKYSKAQQRLFFDAIDFGLRGGFAVPIHTPHGDFANLVIQDGRVVKKIQRQEQLEHYLQLAAYQYHARVSQLITVMTPVPAMPVLTNREIECLYLTAQYKTAKEIARLLNITPRTVGFHIENVLKKLSVDNKYQAVVKAKQCGLLSRYINNQD